MKLNEIYRKYPKQEDCIKLLETFYWNGHPTCPYCGSENHTPILNHRYRCNTCKTTYSVLVQTVFHNTKIPLQKWFSAIGIIAEKVEKVSARELGEKIEVTKDTAWRMMQQINNHKPSTDLISQKI